MPRRRQLKGIASGIASKFISRNNDVDGYWALGLFYKTAFESGKTVFILNLVTGDSSPYFKYSARVAKQYYCFLQEQMNKLGFDDYQITDAVIEVMFDVPPTKRQIIYKHTWGDPLICKVSLTDDLNRTWQSEFRAWCGKHDPIRECRSIRRYAL